jgi:hypothetical protein
MSALVHLKTADLGWSECLLCEKAFCRAIFPYDDCTIVLTDEYIGWILRTNWIPLIGWQGRREFQVIDLDDIREVDIKINGKDGTAFRFVFEPGVVPDDAFEVVPNMRYFHAWLMAIRRAGIPETESLSKLTPYTPFLQAMWIALIELVVLGIIALLGALVCLTLNLDDKWQIFVLVLFGITALMLHLSYWIWAICREGSMSKKIEPNSQVGQTSGSQVTSHTH